MSPTPKKNSNNDELEDFDAFVHHLQEEIDHKDQFDFSPYALSLASDLRYCGTISPLDSHSNTLVIHEWQGPCGDSVKWFLLITKNRLNKVRFQTNGCVTTDIASEQTARMVDQKLISEVRLLTKQHILDALQKFPTESHHCAELALKSLNFTLDKYEEKIS